MKKIVLLVVIALGVSQFVGAQHAAGDKNLNIGIGLGSTFADGDISIPPIGASFEVGIKDNISVGGYLGYTATSFGVLGGDWKYSYTIIGARGSYHFDVLGNEKIDTYGGLMLGYNVVSVDYGNTGFTTGGAASGISYSLYVGGRYAFSDKLGAFAELGYGIAYLQLGANLKF